jgi:hypothetical protein
MRVFSSDQSEISVEAKRDTERVLMEYGSPMSVVKAASCFVGKAGALYHRLLAPPLDVGYLGRR